MSHSLFDILTGPKASAETFPVTDLTSHLIKVIGRDVCGFKRNNQASYCLVSRTRDIYDQINLLIKQVDADDVDEWTNYNLFTAAIDFLEEFLWEVVPVAESESQATLLPTSTTSLDECLSAIKTWKERRKSIRDFSSRIFSSNIKLTITAPSVANADRLEAEKHDDLNLLSALSTSIDAFPPQGSGGYGAYVLGSVSKIRSDVKSIQSQLMVKELNDNSIVLVIQCIMLVNGVAVLCGTVADGQWSKSLKSSAVWQGASKLVSHSKSHIDGAVTLETLQAQYDKFIALLRSQPGQPKLKLPSEYNLLRAYVAKVRRPYFAQAKVLVDQCRLLVEHIRKEGDKHAEGILPLENALKDAIAALGAATEILPQVTKFDEKEIPTNTAGKALQVAEGKIEECYTEYGLSGWDQRKEEMKKALEKDQARIAQLNSWFDNRKKPAEVGDGSSGKVAVTIITHDLSVSNNASTKSNCDEDKFATLSGLMWKEASSRTDRSKFLQKAHFQLEDPSKKSAKGASPLSIDKEVGSLVSQGSTSLTLYLVIKNDA